MKKLHALKKKKNPQKSSTHTTISSVVVDPGKLEQGLGAGAGRSQASLLGDSWTAQPHLGGCFR